MNAAVANFILFYFFQNIKEGIEGHPVNWYSDVFDLVFSQFDRDAANNLWKIQLQKPASEKSKKLDEDE